MAGPDCSPQVDHARITALITFPTCHMKLIELNWNPTARQLRQFGGLSTIALPLVTWIWGGSPSLILSMLGIGAAMAGLGLVVPAVLRPIFVGLSLVGIPIGMVIGELTMLLIFFGVFVPIGLFFRVIKRDALQLKIDPECNSYWQRKRPPSSVASYYRQSR